MKIKKYLISCLVSGLLATSLVTSSYAESTYSKPKPSTYELLKLFGEVFDRVKEEYVEDVEEKELIESAINGMLQSLDPHSSYMNSDDFEDMRVQTRGEFGGLGIEVTMDKGLVKVVSPIDDTPAYDAGVEAGDYISKIDGEQVMGLTLKEAVDKMRGKPGSKILITILREGNTEPIDITIVRDVIRIQSVKSRVEGKDDIGYLRITSFSGQTYTNLRKQIEKVTETIGNDKIKGYVLDLRNNPGGLLTQAIDVSDAFLERGEIVSTRGKINEDATRSNATKGDLVNGLPLVVLINGGSASASEIVAGALQDHRRAIIMGTKSFGKGSVQTVMPMSSNGAMKLTTAKYYTPSGKSIQGTGIEPDIEVKQAKLDYAKRDGFDRKEADLRGSLKNDDTKEGEESKNDKSSAKAGRNEEGKDEKRYQDDFQLARAIDVINAIAIINDRNMIIKTNKAISSTSEDEK